MSQSEAAAVKVPPRPLVPAALALVAGLAAGFALPALSAPAGIAALAAALLGALRLWRSRYLHGPLPGSGAILIAAVAALGAWLGAKTAHQDASAAAAHAARAGGPRVRIVGSLAEAPAVGAETVEIVLRPARLEDPHGSARLLLSGPGVALTLRGEAANQFIQNPARVPLPGQSVEAHGAVRGLEGPGAPGTFSPRRHGWGRGVAARAFVSGGGSLRLGARPAGASSWVERAMRPLRAAIGRRLDRALAAEEAALARALLLGEADRIEPGRRDRFAQAGFAHLLAVSGVHVGLILMLFVGAGRACMLRPRGVAIAAIAGVLFYAALTGFRPPVARAAWMYTFMLGGYCLRRTTTPLASLAAAVFFSLLAAPRNLLRLDWQLSHLCLFALIVFAPPLYGTLRAAAGERGRVEPLAEPPGVLRRLINHWVLLPLAASLAVQLGLLPLQVAAFRQFNPVSLLTNLVAIPLTSWAVWGAALVAVAGEWTGALARWPLDALGSLADALGTRPTLLATPPLAPVAILAAFYLLLLAGRWLRGGAEGELPGPALRRSLWAHGAGGAAFFGVALAVFGWIKAPAPDLIDLYMLDVGQGDALVLRAGGQVMVIDAGPPGRGRTVVAPFLRQLGVGRIDCLVATHADADHIGGMAELVRSFPVGLLVEGPDVAESETFAELREEVAAAGLRDWKARAGEKLAGFEPARVELLGPLAGLDDNDASLAILATLGEVDLLLAGDLEAAGERALLAAARLPDIEILKVAHHGSRSGTGVGLLAAARPELGLISAGKGNRYGHPAGEVLERLETAGTAVARTDRDGSLWIRTDGKKWWLYRFRRN